MLTFIGQRNGYFCDGIPRRSFLQLGAAAGLTLPQLLRAEETDQGKDHSLVMIYLPGGPTQHETFDPKPSAPVEIRGAFGPTKTRVPGVQFCELLPKLAAMSDRFSIVRSLVGMVNRHECFHCYTGRPGGRSQDREPAGGWPTLGSVVSKIYGQGRQGAPPYVDAAPKMSYGPYNNRGIHDAASRSSWPGFTGRAHTPLTLDGDVKDDLTLNGIAPTRLESRRELLTTLGQIQSRAVSSDLDSFQQQAWSLLTSSRLAAALDWQQEDKEVIARYGEAQSTDSSFGGAPQSPRHLLLARRLVEAGVRCVTVAFGAWDWHANREGPIDQLSRKYLPAFDHAISVFLQDLDERGLLERTAVVIWGEFGRTPRINAKGGRDHWPGTQSVLLAGGGMQGGRVIGATDVKGGVPTDRPVHVQEVFATLYQSIGIDVNQVKINDLNGRPRYLVDDNRQPLRELT